MEKLKMYQQAIDYACKQRQSLALELADRFDREKNCEIEPTADREISKFIKLERLDKAKPWLRFFPMEETYITKKKKEGEHTVVFGLLIILNQFDDAIYYARAQAMFIEGIKLATEMKRPDMVINFQLQQATQDMSSSKNVQTEGLLEVLREIAATHHDQHIVAKALLLLAKDKRESNNLTNCRQAYEIYKHQLENPFGEIECYNVLRNLTNQKKTLCDIVKETIEFVKYTNELIKKLKRNQSLKQKMESFYTFEWSKKKNVLYIPKHQDQWSIGIKDNGSYDILCGMTYIPPDRLCSLVQSHLTTHIQKWLDDSLTNLDHFYHDSSCTINFEGSVLYGVEGYIKLNELELQLINFAYQQSNKQVKQPTCNVVEILMHVLSPYSQVRIQFTETEYEAIRNLSLEPVLERKLEYKPKSCFPWLNTWYLSNITTLDHTKHKSIQALRKGINVFEAIKKVTSDLEKDGTNNNSTENIVAFLSVLTTALLATFFYSYREKNTILLPETFDRFVTHFDTVNSKKPGVDLYKASIATAKKSKKEEIYEQVITLLFRILDLLIGRYKNLLQKEFQCSSIDYNSIFHILILTLTIFGNLVLLCRNKDRLRGMYEHILSCIETKRFVLSKIFRKPHMDPNEAKNTRDLFQKVIDKLLQEMGLGIRQLKIKQSYDHMESIKFVPCQWGKLPSISFPQPKSDFHYSTTWDDNVELDVNWPKLAT